MTLHLICFENVDAIAYSLLQPKRLHTLMDGRVAIAIRRDGRHIEIYTSDGWRTANDQNLKMELR